MAGWGDLLDASPLSVPKQVFLCVGEVSSLVWDKVHQALEGYDFHLRVESEDDLSYSIAGMGANSAYLMVDPSVKVLESAETLIRQGATEALFILISGDPDKYPKATFEYLKKKAQSYKCYYTITAPKTQAARDKMMSHFQLRWAVPKESSHKVCSALDYSPGQIYFFDQQFLQCTEGRVLPSTQTQTLVDELLGADSPNLVATRIVSGTPVDMEFSEDFTRKVLMFLHSLIIHARMIQGAWKSGDTSLTGVSKATGLTQFLVLRALGMAESHEPKELRKSEGLVLMGLDNVAGNPDLLSVISRLWRS